MHFPTFNASEQISTRTKIVGVLTLLPAAYAVVFAGIVFGGLLTEWQLPQSFIVGIVIAHFCCMAILFGLFVFYVRHLNRNTHIPSEHKGLWLLTFIVANIVAMPAYWYYYLLHSRDHD